MLPNLILDVSLFASVAYWLIGLSDKDGGGRFIFLIFVGVLLQLACDGWVRLIAQINRFASFSSLFFSSLLPFHHLTLSHPAPMSQLKEWGHSRLVGLSCLLASFEGSMKFLGQLVGSPTFLPSVGLMKVMEEKERGEN